MNDYDNIDNFYAAKEKEHLEVLKEELNEDYLEKIIINNFKFLSKEEESKYDEIIKRAKKLFLLGDISEAEYLDMKKNISKFRKKFKTDIEYDKIIVDENYNVEVHCKKKKLRRLKHKKRLVKSSLFILIYNFN